MRAAACRFGHRDPRPAKEWSHSQAAESRSRPPGIAPPPRKKAAKPTLPEAGKTPGTPRKKTIAAGPKRLPGDVAGEGGAVGAGQLQAVIVGSLEDDKAENIITLDLAGKAIVLRPDGDRHRAWPTGRSPRWPTHLTGEAAQAGLKRVQVEGAGGADWVLIDAGDIVVHLFKPEARTMYALERMWGAELDEVG